MYPQVGLMPWEQEVRGQFGLFKLPVLSTHLCGPWLSSGQLQRQMSLTVPNNQCQEQERISWVPTPTLGRVLPPVPG